jgi:hypothetical protein
VAAIAVQYLEKIFQVVLTLPSLATSGYVSLVDSLINPQAEANRTGLVRDGGQQLLDTALEAVRDVPNKGADQRGCGRGATHFQPKFHSGRRQPGRAGIQDGPSGGADSHRTPLHRHVRSRAMTFILGHAEAQHPV